MKVSKAIGLIQLDLDDEDVDWDSQLGKAYKLSFEALKFYQGCGDLTLFEIINLLPGETPEEEVEGDKTPL